MYTMYLVTNSESPQTVREVLLQRAEKEDLIFKIRIGPDGFESANSLISTCLTLKEMKAVEKISTEINLGAGDATIIIEFFEELANEERSENGGRS